MADRRVWPEAVRQRCFVVWSGRGNRNASRTRWLYGQEVPDDAPLPGASTIRRWAAQECWKDWAGEDVPPLPWRDPRQRRTWHKMWFRHAARQVEVALRAQTDILTGAFDGDSAAAMKTFVGMDRVLAHPALRSLQRMALQALFSEEAAAPVVPLVPRERRAWQRLVHRATR